MRTHQLAAFVVVIVVTFALTSAVFAQSNDKDQNKIPVFVRGAGATEGFTDPSKNRQNSVKDITNKLKGSKVVRLAESESDAVAVLEVLDRETKRETNAWGALGGVRQNKSYLTVRLTAGEFTTEFEGESGSKGMLKGYGAAAGKIVKQLEEWVKTNREKLLALKAS